MSWIKFKTEPGKAEVKERMESLPGGPYIYVPQHREQEFMKSYLTISHEFNRSKNFEFIFGYAVFAVTFDGPVLVGYWWDTGD